MCGKMYRLYFPTLETNDVGDMHIDKVTSDIGPFNFSKYRGVLQMNEKDASQFSINPPEPSPGTKRVPAPPVGNVSQ